MSRQTPMSLPMQMCLQVNCKEDHNVFLRRATIKEGDLMMMRARKGMISKEGQIKKRKGKKSKK